MAKSGSRRGKAAPRAGVDERRYRAPALEKGLDILELVSRANHPLTAAMITQSLGRSVGELFRMLQVLEYRGFIEQSANGAGYVPTAKLFALGMEQAPVRTLLEVALPVMRRLSQEVGQSCHLAVRAGGDITVIARMESEDLIGFAVHVGHRRAIALSASGAVLYAFQSESVRAHWEKSFDTALTPAQLARFHKQVARVVANGYDMTPSDVVKAITDVSAPIMRGNAATAALTIPWFEREPLTVNVQEACARLRAAAAEISAALAGTAPMGAANSRGRPAQTTYKSE